MFKPCSSVPITREMSSPVLYHSASSYLHLRLTENKSHENTANEGTTAETSSSTDPPTCRSKSPRGRLRAETAWSGWETSGSEGCGCSHLEHADGARGTSVRAVTDSVATGGDTVHARSQRRAAARDAGRQSVAGAGWKCRDSRRCEGCGEAPRVGQIRERAGRSYQPPHSLLHSGRRIGSLRGGLVGARRRALGGGRGRMNGGRAAIGVSAGGHGD